MWLRNNFSEETRSLWISRHDCDLCGRNCNLELHHILGRISSNPLNCAMLCRECHSSGFSEEDKGRMLKKTKEYLELIGYRFTPKDERYLELNKKYYE